MAKPIRDDNTKFFSVNSKPDVKDRIDVRIGDDKDPSIFHPQMKMERWDNEANVSFRLIHSFIPGNISFSEENGVITWKKGQWEARFYEDWGTPEGAYKFVELVMPSRPPTNEISFTTTSKDVDFFYQPPLTQQEIDQGMERPDEVVGSYAIYSKSSGGMNRIDGKDYKAGKLGHLLCAYMIDANGNKHKCTYNDDLNETGLLTISADPTWLDNAVYPVVLDPTFGYTTLGATASPTLAQLSSGTATSRSVGAKNTLSENGSLYSVSIGLKLATGTTPQNVDLAGAIYDEDSAGSGSHDLLALDEVLDTSVTTTAAFVEILSSFQSLTADSLIVAGICNASDLSGEATLVIRAMTDSGGSSHNKYQESSTGAGGYATRKAEDPWTEIASADTTLFSMYATYIPSGYPVPEAPVDTDFDTSVTSMAVNMPAAVDSGDLLLALVHVRNAGTWTTIPTNWNKIAEQAGGGSVGELSIFYKIADGTEDGGTATWITDTGTSAAWQVIRVTSWHGTTAPEVTTTSGDVSNADPPSLTPSWGSANTLWFGIAGHSAASTSAWSAGPSGYDGFALNGASSGGAAISLANAWDTVAAVSEDPGAFTASGSNRWWASATVAVRPVAAGGTVVQDLIGSGIIPFAR